MSQRHHDNVPYLGLPGRWALDGVGLLVDCLVDQLVDDALWDALGITDHGLFKEDLPPVELIFVVVGKVVLAWNIVLVLTLELFSLISGWRSFAVWLSD